MGNFIKNILKPGIFLLSFMVVPSLAQAGGAFSTTPNGTPVLWDVPVTWRADEGDLKGGPGSGPGGSGGGGGGCSLSKSLEINNADAVQMVKDAFDTWAAVPNSSIVIEQGPSLGTDVDFSNVENFWVGTFTVPDQMGGVQQIPSNVTAAGCYDNDPNTECLNSVIFDNSTDPQLSMVDAILGECARFNVLAFASILPETADDPPQFTIQNHNLRSSQLMVSGACIPPTIAPDPNCAAIGATSQCPAGGLTLTEVKGVITHEVGHFLGMDHTLVNKEEYLKCSSGPGTCTDQELEDIPTMIGLFVPGANLATLHQDDKSTFAGFYPANNPAVCTLTGTVQTSVGGNGRCFEVVARKQGDERSYAVGSVAGAYVPRFSQGVACPSNMTQQQCEAQSSTFKVAGNCTFANKADCGEYTIFGLEPGTYDVGVHAFEENGNSLAPIDFIIEPCTPVRVGNFLDNPAASSNVTVNCPAQGGAIQADIDMN